MGNTGKPTMKYPSLHRGEEQGEQELFSDPEAGAIMAVIEAETAAWLNRDLNAWANCWVQQDYARRIASRPFGGTHTIFGFTEHYNGIAEVMAAYPEKSTRPCDVRREKLNIRVGSDISWVTFQQVILSGDIPPGAKGEPGVHHHMRVLEKHDGRWLIAAVFEAQTRLGFLSCPWVRIDVKGQVLDMNRAASELLPGHPALYIVGNRLVARTLAGRATLKTTIENAQTSIKGTDADIPHPMLFSDSETGSISLAWISTDDEMLVVLLDDPELTRKTIERAASIFGLSKAQARVAMAISGGKDLSQAAAALGVRPNTVRTHVKRMFEKVGVRSQAALVRALLSTGAPGLSGSR